MRFARRTPLLVAALWLAAAGLTARPAGAQTAPAQDTTARPQAQPQPPARRDRNVITREEIDSRPASDALQVVRTLRPAWLRGARGLTSAYTPTPVVVVYQDALRFGGIESLESIPVNLIVSIRYLDPRSAMARFGADHGAGAIVVTTHRSTEVTLPQ